MEEHALEVAQRNRFEFGNNWIRFLGTLTDERIVRAKASIANLLAVQELTGRTFLDVGCGSGLFSLAARLLGASVHSFDYDPRSVVCTVELRQRFFPNDSGWAIEAGSILDEAYVRSLGQFDVVYSWGVLHHTGKMWHAFHNIQSLVKPGGKLAIAIYNDQGRASCYWSAMKKAYNKLPKALRWTILGPVFLRLWGPTMVRDLLQGSPLCTWSGYIKERGMSPWRDVIDWVGGYPFEVAKPEEIFEFFRASQCGYKMVHLKTCGGGHGCNEFVFARDGGPCS
jgi:2-polyprenyl-6-hydroxyphenyl methylase/3-demethylubiquinone-9 3-methyltransferase